MITGILHLNLNLVLVRRDFIKPSLYHIIDSRGRKRGINLEVLENGQILDIIINEKYHSRSGDSRAEELKIEIYRLADKSKFGVVEIASALERYLLSNFVISEPPSRIETKRIFELMISHTSYTL